MAVLIFLITRCPDCLYTKFSSVKNYMGPVSSWSLSLRGLSQENKLSRLKTKKTPKNLSPCSHLLWFIPFTLHLTVTGTSNLEGPE